MATLESVSQRVAELEKELRERMLRELKPADAATLAVDLELVVPKKGQVDWKEARKALLTLEKGAQKLRSARWLLAHGDAGLPRGDPTVSYGDLHRLRLLDVPMPVVDVDYLENIAGTTLISKLWTNFGPH